MSPMSWLTRSPVLRCPKCGHRLSWSENLPILGWFLLRGRCKACKVAISAQYPTVEFIVAHPLLSFGALSAVTLAITGAEAWRTVVGNTLSGRIEGQLVFEYYRPDGTVIVLSGSDIVKGRWSLEGERACLKFPDEDKDCQTVSRTGDDVTFMRKGGKGYRLKVLPGNPKNL